MSRSEFTVSLQDLTKYKAYETDDTLKMSYRATQGWDFVIKIWPNRKSMILAIQMQGKRAPHSSDWRPIVPVKSEEI